MKRFTLFLAGVISALNSVFAQYAPVSPQVSSAEGLFKTDLYSGASNANIPIYNLSSRDISVPIELIYTGGNGIRVNEEAGWVGTGWHLEVGGFIAQVIKGYDDFNTNGGYIASLSKKIPCFEGIRPIDNANFLAKACDGITDANMSIQDWSSYDLEPDIFILSLPGLKTKFFYDKNNNKFTSNSANLQIIDSEAGYKITITTEAGLSYYFERIEGCVDLSATDARYASQGGTWSLLKISSNITGGSIYFN